MTRLHVRVQPGAPQARLKGWRADGALQLAVAAAPEDGKANRAVLELLAGALGIGVKALSLKRGAASRSKLIEVEGLEEDEVRLRIDRALAATRGTTDGD
jgi:uncharacterized protein YggU (UPF0235/DUF167 family)